MRFFSFSVYHRVHTLKISDFFLFSIEKKLALLAAIIRSTKTKIMTENKQMIMDRESGEPGEQSQPAPIASETSELQQRPQAVSAIPMHSITP